MELMIARKYAKASDSKIKWAVKNYSDWRHAVMQSEGDSVDERFYVADIEDITTLDKKGLCYTMCRFDTKIVKK